MNAHPEHHLDRPATDRFGIGLDIGGTTTKAAVVDAAGGVRATVTIPTRRGGDGVVSTAAEAARAVVQAAGCALSDAHVVGVGIPGNVDASRGRVQHAVNLGIGAEHLELGPRVSGLLGVHVHVENDVRAATLGAERHLTQEAGCPADLAYLSVGTGIAAGYVQQGRLHRGRRSVAGEIGHIPIDPLGPRCACGQTGCIESIASGSAIERRWPTPGGSAALALHDAVVAGDVAARGVWDSVIIGLARAVLLLTFTWDPEVVVVSGGVASLGSALHEAIADRFVADSVHAPFLASLGLATRLRVIEPSVPLGPIGAVRAAFDAVTVAG